MIFRLKNIIFNICHREDSPGLSQLKKSLQAVGVMVVDSWESHTFAFGHVAINRTLYLLDETLFITDDYNFYLEIKEKWGYVSVYIHEYNKEHSFLEVPYVIEGFDDLRPVDMENIYRRYARIPWNILETQRLKVREIQVKDVDALYEIYMDAEISEFTNSLYEDKDKEKEYVKDYIEKVYPFYGYGMWIVVEKESGKIIGRAGFNFREGYRGLEIGYIIGLKYQKKGYATEVCKAIISYAKEELQATEIRALMSQKNKASIRVCEKAGLYHDGQIEMDGAMLEQYLV